MIGLANLADPDERASRTIRKLSRKIQTPVGKDEAATRG